MEEFAAQAVKTTLSTNPEATFAVFKQRAGKVRAKSVHCGKPLQISEAVILEFVRLSHIKQTTAGSAQPKPAYSIKKQLVD